MWTTSGIRPSFNGVSPSGGKVGYAILTRAPVDVQNVQAHNAVSPRYQGSIPEREPEKRLPHPRKAAGAQITLSRPGEVVTKNNNTGLFRGPVIGMSPL